MPDYQLGKIYKIEPICEHEAGDIYIGSTIHNYLSQRMIKHRSDYKRYKEGKISSITSFVLFDKYGIENCKLLLLENYPCNSKDELRAKEGEYIRNIKCINKKVEGRTKQQYRQENKEIDKKYYKKNKNEILKKQKEYYNDNKERILIKDKIYYENNKEKILKRQSEIITCLCGCEITKTHLKRHERTKKHNDLMKEKQQDN